MAVRPNARNKRSVWIFSDEVSCTGKGTLCALIRNLLGEGNCADIPLRELPGRFALSKAEGKLGVVSDENDFDAKVEAGDKLMSLVKGDRVMSEKKFKDPRPFRFRGIVVQAMCGCPKMPAEPADFWDDQLYVRLDVPLAGRVDLKIASEYVKDASVLEYVLNRALRP